jgi:hypothetical protein
MAGGKRWTAWGLALALGFGGAATAADLQLRPGEDVAAALAAAAPGDRVLLADGDYGAVAVDGVADDLTLAAAEGARPRLARLVIGDARGLLVEGLTVEGELVAPGKKDTGHLVRVGREAEDVTLAGLTVRSGTGHRDWTAAEWRRARSGITVRGRGVEVRGSRIEGVYHGIEVSGPDVRVIGNLIDGFGADGIRGLGDGGLYEGNTIQNCAQVDANHADGFQSWARGPDGKAGEGVITGVVVRGNLIRNYTGEPGPLTCHLQGIGMFDGIFADWLIEGNTIEVDHFHGITVLGGERVRVVGNTVRDLDPGPPGPPWIRIGAHKDGRVGGDNLVAENVATIKANPRVTAVRDNLRVGPVR